MTSNPYQSPSIPRVGSVPEVPIDATGISHKDYLKFRRASAFMATTIGVFFILFCVQMVHDSMFVEAAIASGFWIAMLYCAAAILMRRTADEAKLTLTKYRSISSSMRPLCLWMGPLMLITGILQAAWVPRAFQFNPWGFVVCGIAAFSCAFQWPESAPPRSSCSCSAQRCS